MADIILKDKRGNDVTYTGVKTIQVPKADGVEEFINPQGNINITDTQITDVRGKATAQVVDANLKAENIAKGVSVLGIAGTHEGGGGGGEEIIDTEIIMMDNIMLVADMVNGRTATITYDFSDASVISVEPLDLALVYNSKLWGSDSVATLKGSSLTTTFYGGIFTVSGTLPNDSQYVTNTWEYTSQYSSQCTFKIKYDKSYYPTTISSTGISYSTPKLCPISLGTVYIRKTYNTKPSFSIFVDRQMVESSFLPEQLGAIEKITFGENVEQIGDFYTGNHYQYLNKLLNLREIHFLPTTPPALISYVDSFIPTTCKIYVPTGSLSAYTSASNYPSSNTYTYIEE